MTRQLLILRHGKSDWGIDVNDFDRPLKKRGKKAAESMGSWLLLKNLVPDYIISSPAERASNTAEELCKAMELTDQRIQYDSRIYEAYTNDLIAVLADCPANAERILLVGHNPGLEQLLIYLHKGNLEVPDDGKILPTATLAILTINENWQSLSKNCAKALSITRPTSLPDSF
ncbi:MAG: histidine phosphatase family protein [Methylococcales bacterium]|nr:histidine phosphatase family protein [Methylococcales bacterium]